MAHYLIELAVWLLVAFFAGCCVGCVLRKLFGSNTATVEQPVEAEPLVAAPAPEAASAAPVTLAATGNMQRPKGLAAARGGKPDDLQRISGVGPKNEKVLQGLGFFHFDQIAAWTVDNVNWVDDHLKFNGRIKREEWIRQARLLAEGNEEEFARLYGSGGLRDKQGETQSGERTRRS